MTKVKGFSTAVAQSRVADGEANAQIILVQGALWAAAVLLICPCAPSLAWPCSAELRCAGQ